MQGGWWVPWWIGGVPVLAYLGTPVLACLGTRVLACLGLPVQSPGWALYSSLAGPPPYISQAGPDRKISQVEPDRQISQAWLESREASGIRTGRAAANGYRFSTDEHLNRKLSELGYSISAVHYLNYILNLVCQFPVPGVY